MYLEILIDIYNFVAEFLFLNQSVNQEVNNENRCSEHKKHFKSKSIEKSK